MRRRIRSAPGPWALGAALIIAVIAAPFALAAGEGRSIKGGERNPSPNASLSYGAETEIIADNSTYGTRQSNKGSGGAAIYGCRAPANAEPCLRASNLANGQAFQFATGGGLGGTITVGDGGADDVPFTTNAHGVAKGLNADAVDGLGAQQIIDQAVAKAGGGAAPTCPAGTTSYAGVCIETASRGAQDFQGASTTCGDAGRRLATTSELLGFRGQPKIALTGSELTGDVVSQEGNAAYVVVDQQGTVQSRPLGVGSAFRCVA